MLIDFGYRFARLATVERLRFGLNGYIAVCAHQQEICEGALKT